MEIYIVRHAEADFSGKAKDPDNPPLTKKGRSQVSRVTELAGKLGFDPNVIVSSPLLMAKQTASLAREKVGSKSPTIVDECLIGSKKPSQVYSFLTRGKTKHSDKIVLVSHQPLIDNLIADLIGAKANIEVLNGSIVCIRIGSKPAKGKGTLAWLVPPPVAKSVLL